MADLAGRKSRSRDVQDLAQLQLWGAVEYLPNAGAVMTVLGTGTEDVDVPVMNFGYGFNPGDLANAEVITLNMGSDPNQMVAIPTLSRDLQYPWPAGTGGVQHPQAPDRRLEFNDTETHLTDGVFVVGADRVLRITVSGNDVTIVTSGNCTVQSGGDLALSASGGLSLSAVGAVDISSGSLAHNGVNIGDDHRHGGVDTGGGQTTGPVT